MRAASVHWRSGLAVIGSESRSSHSARASAALVAALAAGRPVPVSRGELVEIGGAFRVPDVMAQSGARLVEVGTTNRTRLSDYAEAVTPETAALLKVHRSNFALTGFTEEAAVPELAALAAERGLAVWHDLGSGAFYRFRQPALRGLPTVAQEVRSGADVVTLSGDKLLGSVQAGIVVGPRALVERPGRAPPGRAPRPGAWTTCSARTSTATRWAGTRGS